jgi:hypothetical protein
VAADLIHNSWVDASFLDVVTVGFAAQRVILQRRDPLPPAPTIVRDSVFRGLATLLLARDTIQRAEATIDGLCRPEDVDGRIGCGWSHESYGLVRQFASYDIAAAVTLVEAGKRESVSIVDASSACYLFPGMDVAPRGDSGSFPGRHPVSGSAETTAATKALAARIVAALAAQHTANAAIDAGLANDVDTAFADERAQMLAGAERWYPGVYT